MARTNITNVGLKYLSESESNMSLESISIWDCLQVTDKGIQFFTGINQPKNLRSNFVKSDLKVCHNLKQLILSGQQITDICMRYLAFECKKIEKLILIDITELTNDGLNILASGCKQLKYLYLNNVNCNSITISGILVTLNNCKILEKIEVDENEIIIWKNLTLLTKMFPKVKIF